MMKYRETFYGHHMLNTSCHEIKWKFKRLPLDCPVKTVLSYETIKNQNIMHCLPINHKTGLKCRLAWVYASSNQNTIKLNMVNSLWLIFVFSGSREIQHNSQHTLSFVRTPLCSKAQEHETAVVLIAPATLPAFHTQFGRIISLTTIWAKSANLFWESSVSLQFIIKFERREKNLSLTSGSFSGLKLAQRIGTTSSRSSPTTEPVNKLREPVKKVLVSIYLLLDWNSKNII